MVDLALHQNQAPILRREIAQRQQISGNYLAQLFLKLKRAGLVHSVLGPGGGYVLTRSASEISAGDVLRAVQEPLAPVYCIDEECENTCHRADGCPTRVLWIELGKQIARTLDATTLADLCEQPPRIAVKSREHERGQIPQSAGDTTKGVN
jgi:Rrf2 family protein